MTKGKKTQEVAKKQPKKLTAAQRIEGLERQMMGLMRNIQILAGEVDNTRQVMSSLAKRLNATIQVGESGNISSEAVNNILVEENVSELKGKVDFLLKQGVLTKSESGEVHEKSFVVGRELDEDKGVINPRIQFALASVVPEVKDMLLGKKVGDIVKNEEGDGLLLEVLEVFNIPEKVEKKLEEASEES